MKLDIAIVNYNTDFYLRNLLASIAARLPAERLYGVHVWDNGSGDRSLEVLEAFGRTVPWLHIHESAVNVHHGPALDALLRTACEHEWVLVLDSDVEITRDVLPCLPPLVRGDPAFVGQIHPQASHLYAYLAHVLINRRWYLSLPPFKHHGAPGLDFFRAIEERQIPYQPFRWCDYVRHFGQGPLRQLVDRAETSNALYEFARRERRVAPGSSEREALERTMKQALDAFLAGAAPRDSRGEGPVSDTAPTPEALRAIGPILRPGTARIHRAGVAEAPTPSTERPATRRRRFDAPSLLSAIGSPRRAWDLSRARRLGLVQRDSEIRALLSIVSLFRPRRLLEIGTAHGGTFYLWTRVASSDALLVSVDRPPWELDDPGEAKQLQAFRRFGRKGQRLHFIRSDSHAAHSREELVRLLNSERLDFLFIDGDHSLDGVRRDWLDYAPLVRRGGLIALHDIHPHSKGWGGEVPAFWREIKTRHQSAEIVADVTQDGFGIGLVWM